MGQQRSEGTHEEFVRRVRTVVIERALASGSITPDEAQRLEHTKLLYGIGDGSYRGVCHYGAWENGIGQVDVIEIAASAEESWVQLVGTTIHELGHVLAGWDAGHSDDWKAASARIGLRRAKAAGQVYALAQVEPIVRAAASAIANEIADGSPAFRRVARPVPGMTFRPKPCTAGYGTKGGTSRGAGSGSRMRKVECATCGYTARTTQKWLDQGAPFCGASVRHGRMTPEAGA